jgi:hypothetical protein
MLLETLPYTDEIVEPAREVERRAKVRCLCDRPVVCYDLSSQQRLWARVRDVSSEGISLLLRAPMAPGTKLVTEMKTVDPSVLLTLVAWVVHSTMQPDRTWIVGCRFLSRPHEEDLRALL